MKQFIENDNIMNNSFFRFYKPTFLNSLLAFAGILIFIFNKWCGTNWGFTIPMSIIVGFLTVNNSYLWKYKPFSYLFWFKDFSGRYEGFIQYEYRDENCNLKKGRLKHIKIIHQNGHSVTVKSFTYRENGEPSTPSESIDVSIKKGEDDNFMLSYTYLNEGNSALGFPPHYGTEVIKFIDDESKTLSGHYYTNRLPFSTRGEFKDLKYIDNNLKHKF